MENYNVIIGIDPDCDKSGFSVLLPEEKQIKLMNFSLFALFQAIDAVFDPCLNVKPIVILEKSWNTSHTWHETKKNNYRISSNIGYKVGRNHQIGIIISEFMRMKGYNFIEKSPLKLIWGPKRNEKISHEEIIKFMPIESKKTNQEQRDSALLAWVYAGFGIKIK